MGFLDKVKNMFTEEVEDDIKEQEPIKKEVTHVEIESPVANEDNDIEDLAMDYSFRPEDTRPIFFDESDFKDLDLIDEEPKFSDYIEKEEPKNLYNIKVEKIEEPKEEVQPEEKKIFKPTPIISPVYGILDKNYHKEDIVSRNESSKEEELTEPSIDSIRNKAYGTLEDELENTLFGTNSILFKNNTDDLNAEVKEIDDDAITNLTNDISKELDELLLKKEQYEEEPKHKKEEPKHSSKEEEIESSEINDDDLLDFIDSTLYKEGDE